MVMLDIAFFQFVNSQASGGSKKGQYRRSQGGQTDPFRKGRFRLSILQQDLNQEDGYYKRGVYLLTPESRDEFRIREFLEERKQFLCKQIGISN